MAKIKICHKHLFMSLVILPAFFLAGCEQKEPEKVEIIRPVLAMTVGDTAVIAGREFSGRARAVQEANLAFDVSGTLIERHVIVGNKVEKGQILAELDPTNYSSALKAAKAELTKSQSNFKRAKELIEKDFISKAEYDRLQAAAEVAAADVDKAQKALDDTQIKAPFDGVISELFVENFQAVQAKQQIARLVDTSKIEMVVDIPEVLISLVPKVKRVLVIFDAFPEHEIAATVKEIGAEASETTRTYPVTLIMDQPEDITILPGMAGKTRADPESVDKDVIQSKGLEIPLAAVFSHGESDKRFVWVIDEQSNTVSLREVVTGAVRSTGLLIETGLQPGEWVAIAGVHHLKEGQKVRLIEAQGE